MGPRFWDPPGLLLGPGNAKPVSLVPLGRPRADSNTCYSPPRASKSGPRGFQEAFLALSALMLRFGLHFGLVLVRSPGTLKIKEFCETSSKFCVFAVFSSSRLRDPIWDPPGLRFGSHLAPKMAETSLGIPLGAAKSRSRALFVEP